MTVNLEPLAGLSVKRGLVGGPFGSSLVSNDYVPEGVPVIRGTNLGFGKYVDGEFAFVSEEKVEHDLSRNTATAGDVVYTQRGTLGQVSLVPKNSFQRYVISQSQMRLRVDPRVALADYVYYACSSRFFQKQIADNAIATGVPHINLGILARLTIPLPALPEQLAIAQVLGALDDKIAANTKLAATTDEFLATQLASSLREDHDIVQLTSIASVNASTAKPAIGGQIRYIDIASVGVGVHELPSLIRWEDAPSRARRKVSQGDTFWSTVRPNRRSHSLNLADDPSLVGSTGLAVLSPKKVGFAYLYEVTKRPEFTTYLETVAEGSAYPAVRANRFEEALVPLLREAARDAFESVAAPLRQHVYNLGEENRTLAAARDALLPRLMSGEVRIKDVEKLLEGGF